MMQGKQILKEQRNQLVEKIEDIQKSLDRLDEKIERYEQELMLKEKTLQGIRKKNSGT